MTITNNDLWLTFGYESNPLGPHNPAETLLPFVLFPDQAADVKLIWNWSGEPFAVWGIGEWRGAITLE